MGKNAPAVELADSLRVDWGSFTYRCRTAAEIRDVVGYAIELGKGVAEDQAVTEAGGRRFFTHALAVADGGLLVRWSNPTDKINPGTVSIELQGTYWEQTEDAAYRRDALLDLAELPGFKKCTRLDAQRTVLNPVANSEDIWNRVRKREVWVPGYTGYSQLSPMDSKGEATNGASTVWGRPTAAVRCTTYNKALEHKRPDLNAVRHEVRCRGAAAEGYFDALITELRGEGDQTEATKAERLVCRSIISRHMTYMDTSRYAAIEDRKEWPKNWKREVMPADFMGEVLDGEFTEVKPARRVGKRLKERKAHADMQYGPTYGLWLLADFLMDREDIGECATRLMHCFFSRLKDEQAEELQAITGRDIDQLRQLITEWRRSALEHLEHETERW